MKVVDDILDGKYLSIPGRMAPPKELTEAMGMQVPPGLLTAQKQEVNRG